MLGVCAFLRESLPSAKTQHHNNNNKTAKRRRVSGICETTQNRSPHQSCGYTPFTRWSLCSTTSCSSGCLRGALRQGKCYSSLFTNSRGGAGRKLACCNMSFVVPVKEPQRMEYQLPPPPVSAPGLGGNGAHQVPVGVMQGTLTPHVQAQDEQHRWTQYQQLWRQHVYMNGTSHQRSPVACRAFVAMRSSFQEQGRNGSICNFRRQKNCSLSSRF